MITLFNKYKLFENPNVLNINTEIIQWNHVDTYCFSYYKVNGKQKFFISSYSSYSSHSVLLAEYKKWVKEIYDLDFESWDNELFVDKNLFCGRGKLSGRIFVKEKIISFWDFPKNQEELKEIGNQIKKKYIDIYAGGWKIEIPIDAGKFVQGNTDWGNWKPKKEDINYIPVEEYKTKNYIKRNKEELETPHLMNYEDKKKILGKSKKSDWKKHMEPFESFNSNKLFENPNTYRTLDNRTINWKYNIDLCFSYGLMPKMILLKIINQMVEVNYLENYL